MSVVLRPMAAATCRPCSTWSVTLFGEDAWSPEMFAGELAGEPGQHYLVAAEEGARRRLRAGCWRPVAARRTC